jgi:Cu-Zn family superoxide dismutase
MKIAGHAAAIGVCALLLPACASQKHGVVFQDPSALAVLSPTQGNSVHGVVTFVRANGAALVNVNMTGFKPNSVHGIHVHESGDCTARNASSAGGHFDPASSQHGGPSGQRRHGGDLGNVVADSNGEIYATFPVEGFDFGSGPASIIGRGVVVHVDRDDLISQPAGNSGTRIACGLITRNPDRTTYSKS